MPQRYSRLPEGFLTPWWVYEGLIWLGLAVFAFGLGYGFYRIIQGKRGWKTVALVVACFLGLSVLVYGSFVESRWLTVKHYEVGSGERDVKIVFLTDIHLGYYKGADWGREVVARTNALEPDVILLGGDYIAEYASDVPKLKSLAGLWAPLGVYAITGNHDYRRGDVEKAIVATLESDGIKMLDNANAQLEPGLVVAGVPDDWFDEVDFGRALAGLAPSDTAILLVHNPEVAVRGVPDMPHLPTLMLSGHTHGGQIRLPFVGSLSAMPHNLGRWLDRGQFLIDGLNLIISQGLGESGPRARLFCPPEISLVTLKY